MADRIREDLVRDGRDPDWRLGWEEHLRPDQRRAVEDALKHQAPVADQALGAYAVGLARRRLRALKWSVALAPLHIGLVALWIYFTCVAADPPQVWCWIYIGIGIVWLVAVPMRVTQHRSRLNAAAVANESLAQD
ncbi:MAG: hypothetical protein M3280_13405 [Actinomycetota bacterium]|nr:hypothetical protein [Actinomycetota bacterium]